jgi:hypothetical protein
MRNIHKKGDDILLRIQKKRYHLAGVSRYINIIKTYVYTQGDLKFVDVMEGSRIDYKHKHKRGKKGNEIGVAKLIARLLKDFREPFFYHPTSSSSHATADIENTSTKNRIVQNVQFFLSLL